MIDRKRVILYIMSCVQQEHKTIRNARVAQLVERDLAKVEAAGSSPVSRFFIALKSGISRYFGAFLAEMRRETLLAYFIVFAYT